VVLKGGTGVFSHMTAGTAGILYQDQAEATPTSY